MKKLFFLVALFATVFITEAQAQGQGGDPAAMMQRMKERVKPGLIEKTKISDEQADKVIEINFASQRKKREIRMDEAMSADDKAKKNSEIDAAQLEQLKAIPLTEEQLKAVNTYYEDMRKEQMQRRQNGGNGRN